MVKLKQYLDIIISKRYGRNFIPPFIWCLLLLGISSCGFKPLHGKDIDSASSIYLSQIEIQPIPSLGGVEFYNRMSHILPFKTDSKFLLTATLLFSSQHAMIQKNNDIIREKLKLHVHYSLMNIETGKVLTNGEFRRMSSFSTIFTPFSNIIKNQDVETNLATSAADEIRTRLILFFENWQKK